MAPTMTKPTRSTLSSLGQESCRSLRVKSLCLLLAVTPYPFLAVSAAEEGPSSLIPSWVRARCGVHLGDDRSQPLGATSNDPPALWVYQGALYDPLEGKKIANVQGLELVSQWADCFSDDKTSKSQYMEHCGDLISGGLLSHPNATFDYASTILSRKVFFYTKEEGEAENDDGKKSESLLTSIRLRHKSPVKQIPADQAVALYETATTVIERGKELIVHSEWPNGLSLWGTTSIRNQQGDANSPPSHKTGTDSTKTSLEYTVYTRRRSKKVAQVPDLITETCALDIDSTTVISPKRAALIQFGASSMDQRDRFGARETYSYTNIPKSDGIKAKSQWWRLSTKAKDVPSPCRVQYTRYGEGPPFYAPGRMCTLELRGFRASSLDDVPPLLSSFIQDRIPHFFDSGRKNDGDRLIQKFRQSTLQLLPDPNAPPPSWQEERRSQVGAMVQDAARISTSLLSRVFSIHAITK
jgi:hypothetical protein